MRTKYPVLALAGIGAILIAAAALHNGCAANSDECDPPCNDPLICCDGFCVNPQTDDDNCGECGNECEEGAHCTDGVCPDVCGETVCDVGQACCDDVCSDVQNDPLNCGECGNECEEGEDCIEGVCEMVECDPPCDAEETCCMIPGASPECADLGFDEDHCGACRHECQPEETCSERVCTLTPCEPPCGGDPMTCCGGTCVNTDTDFHNCGMCGNECDPEAADACIDGECTCNGSPACSSSQTCCPSLGCRNLLADPNNCGECGHGCASGYTCTDGECLCGGLVCEEGETCCPAAGVEPASCRDLDSDMDNCGECGNVCGANTSRCFEGDCFCVDDPPCPAMCGPMACDSYEPPGPYEDCQMCCPDDGGCVPMNDDACGTCDTSCAVNEICTPVVTGLPFPGMGTCAFECLGPGDDSYVDVIEDPTLDAPDADVPDVEVSDMDELEAGGDA
jgi:hypothetical protein